MYLQSLFIVFVLFISSPVLAYSGWMNVHIGSNHARSDYVYDGKKQSYNEKNFGLGLSLPVTSKLDVVSGFFENSFKKTSLYLGANYHTPNKHGFSVGVNGGIVSGYEDTPNSRTSIAPMVIPHISYSLKTLRAEVGLIPSLGIEGTTSVVVLTIGNRF